MPDAPIAIIGCEIPRERLFDEAGNPREFMTPLPPGWYIGPLLVLPLWMGGKERFIAGAQATPGGDENFRPLSATHLTKAREWCVTDLTYLGLWDETRFGMWAGVLLGSPRS